MSSWASVAKEICSALGAVEGARATAGVLDAPAANAPPALARARLAAARDALAGPLGEDTGYYTFLIHLYFQNISKDYKVIS